jgi:PIN like domain
VLLLEKQTYFIDRSLGGNLVAAALNAKITADESVETHDRLFPQDTDDDVWLGHVGEKGWIALSKDDAIIHRNAPALVAIAFACSC